jgi:hypothetical protein
VRYHFSMVVLFLFITSFTDQKKVISGFTSYTADVALVYVGKTPCREISGDIGLNYSSDCLKLKWKLTLYRNSKSLKPTTYILQTTFNRQKDITGTWSIEIMRDNGVEYPVYKLHRVWNDKNLTLLVGDENVLFFLDPSGNLYQGNEEFSYTLNRN